MPKTLRILPELNFSSFFKNVMKLGTGNSLAQIIALILVPVIAKIYGPENYGLLSLFTVTVSILSVLTTFKYELAIVPGYEKNNHITLIRICFILILIFSMVWALIVSVSGEIVLSLFNATELMAVKYMVGLGVLLSSLEISYRFFIIAHEDYTFLVFFNIVRQVTYQVVAIALGYFRATHTSLIFSFLVGYVISVTTAGLKYFKGILTPLQPPIWEVLIENKSFPQIQTLSALINNFGIAMPFLFIAIYLNIYEVGVFALAARMLSIPVNIITQSVSQVFFKEGSKAKSNNRFVLLFDKAFLQLMVVSIILVTVIYFLAPPIIKLLFDERWINSVPVIKYLVLMMIFQIPSTALGTTFIILDRIGVKLIWDVIINGLRLISILIFHDSLMEFVISMVVFVSIGHLGNILYMRHMIKQLCRSEIST